jgi:hypothetical protein
MWKGHAAVVKEYFRATGLMMDVEQCSPPEYDTMDFIGANGLHVIMGTKNCLFTLTSEELCEHRHKRKFKKLLRQNKVGRFEVINY